MAKTKTSRRGLGLGSQIFLIVALLAILLAAGTAALSFFLGQTRVTEQVEQDLGASHSLETFLRQLRHRQLELISRIFSTDEVLLGYLSEAAEARDLAQVYGTAQDYQNILTFDLGVVLDADGIVLARTDDPTPEAADLSNLAQITVAQGEQKAFGVWRDGEQLYHAVTVELARDFKRVGYLLVAFAIDRPLAVQLSRITGAEMVFLADGPTGPVVAGATVDPQMSGELISTLRKEGELLNRLLQRGERVTEERLELQGVPWAVRMEPLRDASEQPVGAVVSMSSLAEKVAPYQQVSLAALGLGAGALLLGFLLSQALGVRYGKPIRQLADAVEGVQSGGQDAVIPKLSGGDTGRLATALRSLLGQWRGKQALEFFASGLARFLPEPAKAEPDSRPQTGKVALAAIEMRRFANPKVGYDAEESLGRMARDLRRITASVESRQGRIAAVAGHKVVFLFEGEGASHRGLVAACEILLALSERENVFDEPDPPAVAMTEGNVVTGALHHGGRTVGGLAGLPVQQLESLLREATPGEVFLSKSICLELVEPLRQAGAQLRAQRGLVSPQPIYVLGAEQARMLAGQRPDAGATQVGFPGDSKSVSDVSTGVVLGERFEVLAELGTGLQGSVFKALDRQQNDLVTLKILKPEVLADAMRFERLKQTIQRLRSLGHPNLLQVLDFGEVERLPYISMEFVRAMNLRHVIDHSRWLPLAAGVRLAQQLASGLAAAHEQGIVHGGVKPENVLVEPRGHARMMDFALAPLVRAAGSFGPAVAGVSYLAPEQLEGREPEIRSDVYGLGAVIYELFTKKVPYAGSHPSEVQLKLTQEEAVLPSALNKEVPSALDQILMRCLAKMPDQRFSSAQEILDALDALA